MWTRSLNATHIRSRHKHSEGTNRTNEKVERAHDRIQCNLLPVHNNITLARWTKIVRRYPPKSMKIRIIIRMRSDEDVQTEMHTCVALHRIASAESSQDQTIIHSVRRKIGTQLSVVSHGGDWSLMYEWWEASNARNIYGHRNSVALQQPTNPS